MSHFGSTYPFSPISQWRSLENDVSPATVPLPADFGGPVFRSLAPLDLGSPFQKPSFSGKELGDAEGDFSLGIQPSKADSFGILGLLPRSAPSVELPLVPAWVCIHTSFVLRLPPAVAFAKILDILRSPSFGITVDVQAQSDKLQLKGKGVRAEAMTYFKKKLYRNSANDIVVECTRQDGCVVLFNKVYQNLLAALGAEARRLAESGSRATSPSVGLQSFPPTPLFHFPSEACSPSLLRNMLLRAGSQFLDEQFQACQALVSVSTVESAPSWRELSGVDVLGVVTGLLKSESEDTAHLATLLLLNLFKLDFREAPQAMVDALITLLDSPPTFKNQDTKRNASTAVRMIVQSRKQAFSASQRTTLEFYQKSSDPVLSENALSILKLVC